jgi:hypothetical protein
MVVGLVAPRTRADTYDKLLPIYAFFCLPSILTLQDIFNFIVPFLIRLERFVCMENIMRTLSSFYMVGKIHV